MDISTESLAGLGIEYNIAVPFSFQIIVDRTYQSVRRNVFQGCIMDFVATFKAQFEKKII